jgi:hypothetical protein
LIPDIAGPAVDVAWALDGASPDGLPSGSRVRIEVIDPDGVALEPRESIPEAGATAGLVRLQIPEAQLWDIGRPALYRATVSLIDDSGALIDVVTDRFGMREIRTAEGRVLLNGQPVFLLGALDQDVYPTTISTPPDAAYLQDQMRLAREMGINLLRCHIKVPDHAYLDAADEAGIMVWCELPNWTRFTSASAARGRDTLEAMVEDLGNHPSVVVWTIINEDWGTDIRYEARDRIWLRETYTWLKSLDPSRLVVDNSACETLTMPNFHLVTDLADFHIYFLAPDNAVRWRNTIDDFARRARWIWSPHGDAQERGDEPLVLSEFGGWGLPRLDRLVAHTGREPWWFGMGRHYYRPSGLQRRFTAYGLDRVWPTYDDLAEATQWHQFEALQYEIGQLRRHDSISGFVITELTDAYWEANGLLDVMRGRKVFHERLPELISPDVIHAQVARRDYFGRERLTAELSLAAYGPSTRGGEVHWTLEVDGRPAKEGRLGIDRWPEAGTSPVGTMTVDVPDVDSVSDAWLRLTAVQDDGTPRAIDSLRLVVLPTSARRTGWPVRVAVHDPLDIWGIGERVRDLGHHLVEPDEADVVIASEMTESIVGRVDAGGRALILVRSRGAIPADHDLARRVGVHLRRLPHAGYPGQRSPWEGDWVTSWSWMLPGGYEGLPRRNPLDFAYEEVLPDHVLLGHDPVRHRDEVTAGMFVGWLHSPAALVWTFHQGRGAMTLTTFRVAPESGPVATALLDSLIQRAAGVDRRRARARREAVAAADDRRGSDGRRTAAS